MASAARAVVGGASLLDEALVRALASADAPEVRALHIKVVGGIGALVRTAAVANCSSARCDHRCQSPPGPRTALSCGAA